MADLKIKIKLGDFELEIEGDKESVKSEFQQISDSLISKIIGTNKKPYIPQNEEEENIDDNTGETLNTSPQSKATSKPKRAKKANKPTTNGKKAATRQPKQLMDLNLRPKGATSLKEFYSQYEIKSNFERNVTYVYYLKNNLKIEGISVDHIYTCYKETGQKVPENIYQSLVDTKKHKGWIDTNNVEDIKLSIQGENYIEHDALKANSKK